MGLRLVDASHRFDSQPLRNAQDTAKQRLLLLIRSNRRYEKAKRLVDVVLSMAMLILFFPLIILISLLIILEDGRPVVFEQERVGFAGTRFIIKKFRSLRSHGFDESNPNGNIEKRVLRIGRFIRRTRLDELLNLFCVLKGDMSLVGPRPEMLHFSEKMHVHIPGYSFRHKVKPGITGWAQINYHHCSSVEEYRKKTAYDLYYIRRRGLGLDFRIMLKTIEVLLLGFGSR